MTDLIIIGGGSAGLISAITAAKQGCSVVIIEKEERVGRKLLSTGNGQCNLSNRDLSMDHFHGSVADTGIAQEVFAQVPFERVEAFWKELGIDLVEQQRGKLYPRSLQASSVLNNLRRAVDDLGVKTVTGKEVKKIEAAGKAAKSSKDGDFGGKESFSGKDSKKAARRFKVYLQDGGCLEAKKVILCAGGKASPHLGSNGSGYQLAGDLKLKVSALRPGICRVLSPSPYCKRLAGLRMTVPAALVLEETDGTETAKNAGTAKAGATKTGAKKPQYGQEGLAMQVEGEVLFTEEGLSGPAILDLSRKAGELLEQGKSVSVSLDLAPEYSAGELFAYLEQRLNTLAAWSLEDALEGWLPKKIIPVVLLEAKAGKGVVSRDVDKRLLGRLVSVIKAFTMPLSGLAGFQEAQVTVGGVLAEEVSPHLEAKRVQGLFLAGEILDLDGDCGGYNLLWAAASAICAAESAAVSLEEHE